MGAFREGSLKMWGGGGAGFQSGPSLKKEGILEIKITKKRSFGAAHVGKVEQTNVYF